MLPFKNSRVTWEIFAADGFLVASPLNEFTANIFLKFVEGEREAGCLNEEELPYFCSFIGRYLEGNVVGDYQCG